LQRDAACCSVPLLRTLACLDHCPVLQRVAA